MPGFLYEAAPIQVTIMPGAAQSNSFLDILFSDVIYSTLDEGRYHMQRRWAIQKAVLSTQLRIVRLLMSLGIIIIIGQIGIIIPICIPGP